MTPPGIDPGTVRLVEQRLNHYATPGLFYINQLMENRASHKRMKCTAKYETVFGSPTAAGLRAPFLPDAVVSTLQNELL